MNEGMLLVAIGCGRLRRMLEIAVRNRFVVLGAMEGEALAGLPAGGSATSALPVYFYETG